MTKKELEKKEICPMLLKVNGKFTKKDIKYFEKNSWDLKSFLFSQVVAFRQKDEALMTKMFKYWWRDVIKQYGKSKWIECIIFCRLEKQKKTGVQEYDHNVRLRRKKRKKVIIKVV